MTNESINCRYFYIITSFRKSGFHKDLKTPYFCFYDKILKTWDSSGETKIIRDQLVAILKRRIIKIRAAYPEVKIITRTDSGFSCAPFYELADQYGLFFATGQASNAVLKKNAYPYYFQTLI